MKSSSIIFSTALAMMSFACGQDRMNLRSDSDVERNESEKKANLYSATSTSCSAKTTGNVPQLEIKQVGNLIEMSWCRSSDYNIWVSSSKGAVLVGHKNYRKVGNQQYARGKAERTRLPLTLDEFNTPSAYRFWVFLEDVGLWSTSRDLAPKVTGDVDGDGDFDANDALLIYYAMLGIDGKTIDKIKGASSLNGEELIASVKALSRELRGDVDRDGDFDANDAHLIYLAKIGAPNSTIHLNKGRSYLSVAQIRQNIEQLKP